MADFIDDLSDAQLRMKLAEFGFPVVPITTTTRKVLTKKLKMLIDNKNKINTEGRRSLAKFSSEEESDEEVKSKDKIRRATVAAGMLPPVSSKTRKSTRKIDTSSFNDMAEATSQVTTESKSRRTTRIIAPVPEADMETGSDSEPEVMVEYLSADNRSLNRSNNSDTKPSSSTLNRSYTGSGTSYLSPRSPLGQNIDYAAKPASTTSYSSTTRYSSTMQDPIVDNSYDKLNQIRARLSLSTNYDRPTFGTSYERHTIGNSENDAPKRDTPFLSNFSKRLSQLSNTSQPKPDYSYKNDIIKEHDSNGSSLSNRTYLSSVFMCLQRARTRDYPQDFKSSQEKNIFKNNIVSFTLVGIAIAFFIAITFLYMGMRSDQPALADVADYKTSHCQGSAAQPGINCVLETDITDTINLMRVLLPELTKRAVTYQCSDPNQKPQMDDEAIIDFVISNYALKDPYEIQKAINNLQVLLFKNTKWGISLVQSGDYVTDSTALETMDQLLSNRHQSKLAMVMLHPDLPWKCILYNKIYTIISSLFIIALGFSGIFMGQKGYRYILKQRKMKNDQIFSMVEKIIDILQSNATDNADNFLAVNHVRDMIMPPQDRQVMLHIWNAAVKFLEENESRVRTEVQIVSGEEFHVWRWLGSANLSMTGSPKSKSWQGQAFETQSGSVNSLPCSPTPCLKIRGMFDERERNFYTVREAVLWKCANKCEILHCEGDLTSGCVYLKCSSQAEAAIAYQNLHGWWYDGNLVTVKYLRLERYMQRFPDSASKGPPYLIASTNLPAENDWSTKDD